jgi:hypothetical protein
VYCDEEVREHAVDTYKHMNSVTVVLQHSCENVLYIQSGHAHACGVGAVVGTSHTQPPTHSPATHEAGI